MWYLFTCFILGSYSLIAQSLTFRSKLIVYQTSGKEGRNRVLVAFYAFKSPGKENSHSCKIFTSPQLINRVLEKSKGELVYTSTKNLKDIVEECSKLSSSLHKRLFSGMMMPKCKKEDTNCGSDKSKRTNKNTEKPSNTDGSDDYISELTSEESSEKLSPAIYPGTKWCGVGDVAKNYNDLGFHRETDKCCRTHDHCKNFIAAGKTKHHLKNNTPFTKLSCRCDNKLYHCLENVNSETSNMIGNIYFNILRNECFAKVYPPTNQCKKYETFLNLICAEPKRDRTARKEYEFFKAKPYTQLPLNAISDKDTEILPLT